MSGPSAGAAGTSAGPTDWKALATKREGSNGKKVTQYQLELGVRVPERQTIAVQATKGAITGGQYRLTFVNAGRTRKTRCVAWEHGGEHGWRGTVRAR